MHKSCIFDRLAVIIGAVFNGLVGWADPKSRFTLIIDQRLQYLAHPSRTCAAGRDTGRLSASGGRNVDRINKFIT